MDFSDYLSRIDLQDYLVIGVNVLLMLLARRILLFFKADNADMTGFTMHVQGFRALNLLIILSYGYQQIYLTKDESGLALKLVAIWVILYLAYLMQQLLSYWIHNKYGKQREVNGVQTRIETYTSRLLSLLSGLVMFVIALISVINVLEFTSLLQAGGVVGLIGVFLALTQNAWAPDIISGLIFLNNGMIEEGDVIEINDNGPLIGVVFKTKMFHTEVLNLVNNHRIMLKNARLREFTIQNLSKFASARGLREQLSFKIGYEYAPEQVRQMFKQAALNCQAMTAIQLAGNDNFELGIKETGDHAVEWGVYYYTKDVRSLIKTRQAVRECILTTAREAGISLATPFTHSPISEL